MNTLSIPIYNSTFLDIHGATTTKFNSPTTVLTKKGWAFDCNATEYLRYGVIAGNYDTILFEVYLDSEVTAASAINLLGSAGGGVGGFCFGIVDATYTNETFSWIEDSLAGGGYIRDNIPRGHNQIILIWNGSYYDCWLNGVQVTTYNNGSDRFGDDDVYIGKRETAAQYFTGKITNVILADHSYSNVEVARAKAKFDLGAWVAPPVRGFDSFIEGTRRNYPPAQSTTYVKATSEHVSGNYHPYYATDPTKSLTGTFIVNAWVSTSPLNPQRFHIDLGSSKTINKVYYENGHHLGGTTDIGGRNFTLWGSNTASDFADLVYANDGTWVQLTTDVSEFDEHVALDQSDPKYINVTNDVSYRYYAFKFADDWGSVNFIGIRRIELRIDKVVHTIGMPYLHEQFHDNPIDSVCNPKNFKAGTGSYRINEVDKDTKELECTGNGTILKDLVVSDTSKTIKLTYDIGGGGGGGVDYEDTIANAIIDLAVFFSFTGSIATFNLSTGEKIINHIIISD